MDGSINGKSSLRFVNKTLQRPKKYSIYFLFLLFTTFLCLKSFKEINENDLKVSGTKYITKEMIIKNSSLTLPKKLILIKTKYLEKELKENLSLKNISIQRQIFPFRLKVFLEQRIPVAYAEINKEQIKKGFIDEEGFFIDEQFAFLKSNLPYKFQVIGWEKSSQETLSSIIQAYKIDEDLEAINISKEGFITLKEKQLKQIFLGDDPEKIDLQLIIIFEIKKQLKNKEFFGKIENLDLTDVNNPSLKVFKP